MDKERGGGGKVMFGEDWGDGMIGGRKEGKGGKIMVSKSYGSFGMKSI